MSAMEARMEPLSRKQSSLQRVRKHFPYWILPIISGTVWFAMLWALLITWLVSGRPHYVSMAASQKIAYISDVGATYLKPLFITCAAITGVFFFLSLCAMRRNQALIRRLERTLDMLSILAGLMGCAAIILLSVFDTRRHPSLHRLFLFLFMLGIVLSALFTTLEYRRLGRTFKVERKIIGISYRVKEVIVLVEVGLSIAFGVTMYKDRQNVAAILEWTIAFVFTFYVYSFFWDLRPQSRTKEMLHEAEMAAEQDAEQGPPQHQTLGDRVMGRSPPPTASHF